MPKWWEQDKEPNQWWDKDSTVALQNDPNDVTVRAKESLEVADNLELPLSSAEEVADALDGQKVERPGFLKRGVDRLIEEPPWVTIPKRGLKEELRREFEVITGQKL